jgi:hypothetical protein
VAIEAVANRTELASLFAGMATAQPTAAPSAGVHALSGRGLWLADNPEQPQLLVSQGLPAAADFIRMFGSTGREPGAETIY